MHSTRDICRRCRWPRRLMTPRDCSLRFNQGEGCIPNQVSGRTCGRSNMKIAQIAPLAESIPPKLYGGTERIVSYLTEELVSQKHDVTLFASADSRTKARLAPACESALRLSSRAIIDPFVHYVRLLELVFRQAHEFDILHFHIDYLHFPLTRRQLIPAVTTLHGKLTIPDLVPLYREYFDMPVVSISDSQRHPLPWIGWS